MLAFVLLAAVTTIVSSPHTSSARVNWGSKVTNTLEKSGGLVSPVVTDRGGYYGKITERNEPLVPSPARCMPEMRTVQLRNSNDLSLQYVPSCTRVERCGGCCLPEEYRSCQPTEIEYIRYKVTVNKYVGGSQFESRKEIVNVERHVKCKCDCIKKQHHCNALQEYRKHDCKCVCTNYDEKRKCLENPKVKSWEESDCTCHCINVKECSTGYIYNKHTCSCEPEQRQRIKNDARGYRKGVP